MPSRDPRPYVTAWAVVALGASLGLVVFDAPQAPPASAFLFLALTAVAERADLRLHHGTAVEGITLVEAAVAASILLFPATWALLIAVGGIAIAHLVQRPDPVKLGFNLSQYAASTVAALAVFHLVRGGPARGVRDLVAVALGMVAFGAVNSSALAGVVARVEGRRPSEVVREDLRLAAIVVLGNTAVGILAAVLWDQRPGLVLLLAVPAFTLHLAYRGVVRSSELLSEVAAERDRLDRVVAGASDGIVLVDADGRVEVWSPAMSRLTGIPAAEALRAPIGSLVPDGDAPLVAARLDEPIQVVEQRIVHRGGGERTVIARHTLLFDERGRPAGDVVLVRDVTREREVEGMKDDFVARVSHELRTPLTPIKGYAQSLARRPDMAPELRQRAVEAIAERADHMARLIDDLLLVARVSEGRADLTDQVLPEATDVPALAERTLDVFRVSHPDRVFTAVVDGAPPAAWADPVRVEQVLANLLSNACKYSPPGTPVAVRVARLGDELAVSVADRGRGIPPDHVDRVFERFHRVEEPMRMETGGIGLGLFIAREFAVAMGGQLTVESRLGVGSVFTLRLPTAVSGNSDGRERVHVRA